MAITRTQKTDIVYQEFLSSGTYYKPSTASLITIELVGGGGGGRSGQLLSSTSTAGLGSRGGQGGGGVYVTISADSVPSVVGVFVGAGGAGGAATTVVDGARNPGSEGTSTSFYASGTTPRTTPGIYLNAQTGAAGGYGNGQSNFYYHYDFPFVGYGNTYTPLQSNGYTAGISWGDYSQAQYLPYTNDIGGGGGGTGGTWANTSAATIYEATVGARRYGIPHGSALFNLSPTYGVATTGGGAAAGVTQSGRQAVAGANGTRGDGGGGGGAAGKTSGLLSGAAGGNGGFPGGGGGGGGTGYSGGTGGAGGNGGNGRVRIWTTIARV